MVLSVNEYKIGQRQRWNFSEKWLKVIHDASVFLSSRQNRDPISYIAAALEAREIYQKHFGISNPTPRIIKEYPVISTSPPLTSLILKTIESNFECKSTLLNSQENYTLHQGFDSKSNFKFLWTQHNEQKISCGFYQSSYKHFRKEISDLIWNENSGLISLMSTNFNLKFSKYTTNKIIFSSACKTFSETFSKFLDQKINRSVLFHGPPGTGKSSLAVSIASFLNKRTILIDSLENLSIKLAKEICNFLQPESLIFDDIDHSQIRDFARILTLLESTNINCPLILATANRLRNLDSTMVRPERFDYIIPITILEPEIVLKLVENDLELFEIAKNWPIVFILELMKRVKALGKIEAINSVPDLIERLGSDNEVKFVDSPSPQILQYSADPFYG